jgi:hypothetical protein
MKLYAMTSKDYLVAIGVVMIINLGLSTYLFKVAFAQTYDLTAQKIVNVDALLQQDSPLLLSISNVNNSEKDFQTINYVAQNTSSKSVRAYVMLQKDSIGLGKTVTNYFYPAFLAGQTITNSISIERPNVKPDAKILLAIDYVQFADGTFWGADAESQSERISGHIEGYKYAVSDIKRVLAEKNGARLVGLLRQDITASNPTTMDQTKPELWQRGFVTGYRTVLSRLQTVFAQKGIEEVSNKLSDMGKFELEEK